MNIFERLNFLKFIGKHLTFSPRCVVCFGPQERGADVNVRSFEFGASNNCALLFAARLGSGAMVQALLDAGADVGASVDGDRAVDIAERVQNRETLMVLRRHDKIEPRRRLADVLIGLASFDWPVLVAVRGLLYEVLCVLVISYTCYVCGVYLLCVLVCLRFVSSTYSWLLCFSWKLLIAHFLRRNAIHSTLTMNGFVRLGSNIGKNDWTNNPIYWMFNNFEC